MAEAVLLVAHGSRSSAGRDELLALAGAVRAARPATPVHVGFLELSDPPAARVLRELADTGAREVVVVPLMLFSAGHAKSDVPAVVVDARLEYPDARIHYARPLGVDHRLLALARRRLEAAGALGMPLAVLARGTSDPDANAEAWRASRLLADMAETQRVATGFSGLTWPSVTGALEQLHRLGATSIAVFSWFLATGVLLDTMRADVAAFAQATGVEIHDAGHFGTEPELVGLVWNRVDEVGASPALANCDTCAYRYPFPGLADRVNMAIGVGHSHLAAEHRHHAASHGHAHHHGDAGDGDAGDGVAHGRPREGPDPGAS